MHGICPNVDRSATAQPLPGAVQIVLGVVAGQVVRVRVNNARITGPFPALLGTPVSDLPMRLARLFPVCAVAHRVVAEAALAATGAGPAPDPVAAGRDLALEVAMSQVWRAAVDWPRACSLPPCLAPVKSARLALAAADHLALAEILAHAVFGGPVPQHPLDWLAHAETPGARLWQAARGWTAQRPMPPALGARDARWFAVRLAENDRFPSCPEVDGAPADPTEPAGPEADGPLAQRIAGHHWQALRTIADLRAGQWLALDSFSAAPGVGAAVVATARGPLAALVRVTGGRTADLRLSAPSEWTLHPDGSLVRLIEGAPADRAETQARLAIAACDPCAEVEIATEPLSEAHYA